jgi:hypothetical protein
VQDDPTANENKFVQSSFFAKDTKYWVDIFPKLAKTYLEYRGALETKPSGLLIGSLLAKLTLPN